MKYEVEQKFRVPDPAAIERRLGGLGARWGEPREEVDTYYAHPARDFARTDEALRIRRVGRRCAITYKGPKVDATTKTRRELEIPLDSDRADSWAELLAALGFRPAGQVRKRRRKAHVDWQARSVEVALDEVDGLGTFLELELQADDDQLNAARECLASLATELNLSGGERRSYLELVLGSV
jgi:adenylate cyclase, class 2